RHCRFRISGMSGGHLSKSVRLRAFVARCFSPSLRVVFLPRGEILALSTRSFLKPTGERRPSLCHLWAGLVCVVATPEHSLGRHSVRAGRRMGGPLMEGRVSVFSSRREIRGSQLFWLPWKHTGRDGAKHPAAPCSRVVTQ